MRPGRADITTNFLAVLEHSYPFLALLKKPYTSFKGTIASLAIFSRTYAFSSIFGRT